MEIVQKQPNGGWRIAGTRVSLQSLVHELRVVGTNEELQKSYPSLTLDEIAVSIRFYEANREEVDAWLAYEAKLFKECEAEARVKNADFRRKILERADALNLRKR